MKRCGRCGISKATLEFHVNRSTPDGRSSRCIVCTDDHRRKRFAEDPERFRKRARVYYRKNRDKLRLSGRLWRVSPRGRLRSAMKNAATRGISFAISIDQYKSIIFGKPCIYCGGDLPPSGSGLDRKDNSIGYTVENLVPCCRACNTMKGKYLTYDEMLMIWRHRRYED